MGHLFSLRYFNNCLLVSSIGSFCTIRYFILLRKWSLANSQYFTVGNITNKLSLHPWIIRLTNLMFFFHQFLQDCSMQSIHIEHSTMMPPVPMAFGRNLMGNLWTLGRKRCVIGGMGRKRCVIGGSYLESLDKKVGT